jgi:hypothetical protein
MPANEGGTHGLCERMRSDGEIRRRTPMNAEIQGNLTWELTAGRARARWVRGREVFSGSSFAGGHAF